ICSQECLFFRGQYRDELQRLMAKDPGEYAKLDKELKVLEDRARALMNREERLTELLANPQSDATAIEQARTYIKTEAEAIAKNTAKRETSLEKEAMAQLKEGIERGGVHFYPEEPLLTSGKHGLEWTEGPARAKKETYAA